MALRINERSGGTSPDWMLSLADSVAAHVTPEVIDEIIANQVKRAKAGSTQAAEFVLRLHADCQRLRQRQENQAIPTERVPAIEGPDGVSKGTRIRKQLIAALRDVKRASPGQLAARLGADEAAVRRTLKLSGAFQRCKSREEMYEIHPQLGVGGGAR